MLVLMMMTLGRFSYHTTFTMHIYKIAFRSVHFHRHKLFKYEIFHIMSLLFRVH